MAEVEHGELRARCGWSLNVALRLLVDVASKTRSDVYFQMTMPRLSVRAQYAADDEKEMASKKCVSANGGMFRINCLTARQTV